MRGLFVSGYIFFRLLFKILFLLKFFFNSFIPLESFVGRYFRSRRFAERGEDVSNITHVITGDSKLLSHCCMY
jgi:hypothetical protein